MIDRGQVAVVIPTYKMILSEIEQISLSQVFKVLNGYDIYFVAPEGLEAEYLKMLGLKGLVRHILRV